MGDIKDYKCLCCGAPLIYDGSAGALHCESCGTDFALEDMENISDAMGNVQSDSTYDWENYEPREFTMEEGENLATFSCPACGAEITGDGSMGSAVCPYCGSSTVMKDTFEGTYKPDFVIPFEVDKKAAIKLFEEDSQIRPFIPDEFKDRKRIEEMTGIYIPFWIFDCDCDARLTYDAVSIRMWSDSDYDYTEKKYYKLYRSGSLGFENIPVDASLKAEDAYMDALEPFDYSKAVNFNTGYLSGYLSDKYDVSVDDSIERANTRVKNSTEEVFMNTTGGYDIVTPEFTNLNVTKGKVRYSLLPVWMLNINYGGQNYQFAVNGQSGKVVGDYPVDISKKKRHFRNTFLKFFIPLGIAAAAVSFFAL